MPLLGGAGTWRITGRGSEPHNIPRLSPEPTWIHPQPAPRPPPMPPGVTANVGMPQGSGSPLQQVIQGPSLPPPPPPSHIQIQLPGDTWMPQALGSPLQQVIQSSWQPPPPPPGHNQIHLPPIEELPLAPQSFWSPGLVPALPMSCLPQEEGHGNPYQSQANAGSVPALSPTWLPQVIDPDDIGDTSVSSENPLSLSQRSRSPWKEPREGKEEVRRRIREVVTPEWVRRRTTQGNPVSWDGIGTQPAGAEQTPPLHLVGTQHLHRRDQGHPIGHSQGQPRRQFNIRVHNRILHRRSHRQSDTHQHMGHHQRQLSHMMMKIRSVLPRRTISRE